MVGAVDEVEGVVEAEVNIIIMDMKVVEMTDMRGVCLLRAIALVTAQEIGIVNGTIEGTIEEEMIEEITGAEEIVRIGIEGIMIEDIEVGLLRGRGDDADRYCMCMTLFCSYRLCSSIMLVYIG